MTLDVDEFIRRFLIHTLPPGFQRIRYFGWMANRYRKEKLGLCRALLSSPITALLPAAAQRHEVSDTLCGPSFRRCPKCRIGILIRIAILPAYRWPERPPDSS
jgi:hypothetical protein